MTDVSDALKELSEPWERDDRMKAAIDRAARRSGLSYWRAFDIWYGKARRIEPHEIAAINSAVDRKRREATRNELHDLRLRLARLEALLARADTEFSRADAAASRTPACGSGGMDRALAAKG